MGSRSAIQAAIIQARLISGRYRTDALLSKWSASPDVCSLPNCQHTPADIVHLLSGKCPALGEPLLLNLENNLKYLQAYPQLLPPVLKALNGSDVDWVTFLLDTSTDPLVIQVSQAFGRDSIYPLFHVTRMYA